MILDKLINASFFLMQMNIHNVDTFIRFKIHLKVLLHWRTWLQMVWMCQMWISQLWLQQKKSMLGTQHDPVWSSGKYLVVESTQGKNFIPYKMVSVFSSLNIQKYCRQNVKWSVKTLHFLTEMWSMERLTKLCLIFPVKCLIFIIPSLLNIISRSTFTYVAD